MLKFLDSQLNKLLIIKKKKIINTYLYRRKKS